MPVILFDGFCILCNRAVDFIIRHDRDAHFRFAPLQSKAGRDLLGTQAKSIPDSIVLVSESRIDFRSTAFLKICRKLDAPWSFLSAFLIVPRFIRDPVYDLIARNRYSWFGKRNSCRLPEPGISDRFLKENGNG